MAKGTCTKVGCTIAESGTCLLLHPTPEKECPNFRPQSTSAELDGSVTLEAAKPRDQQSIPLPSDAARHFYPGLELGSDDAAEIGRARYCHLIGVLGSQDAGKTCYLLSLYLMASRGALPNGHIFAGSKTLKGFEERARRLREWRGGPLPDQLADHTHLADPRRPALLHLAFRETQAQRRRFDVTLTDLPGEWSEALVDRAATANRFEFLKRADGIILVVDGPSLVSQRRHSEVERTKLLMERLTHSVRIDPAVPMTLLLTKCDTIDMKRPDVVDDLLRRGEQFGFKPKAVLCAAFSKTPDTIKNGVGVFEAIEGIVKATSAPSERNRDDEPLTGRSFQTFGRCRT